ncbi:hypothetical protein RSOLAG1IB_07334 [Rhizoctonia solani AG-1 IB]|uniref:F-box domain-containing protein n=1 Tax=Thanatephorus cucumeris (strain AG1-IB / isolate 7/3/14) TaxID=1108050 RepID=A0A0B7FB82_THACB|nr:hypothetical protein RSOLAG1IB_07334 [Rhizoctonia solani AG-1 IB]
MTETLDRFLQSESRLQAAVEEFLTACSALHNINLDDHSTNNNDIDHKLNQIRARRSSLIAVEKNISKSQTLLNDALERFPPPASMRRLPTELLSRIFRHTVPRGCRSYSYDGTRILLVLTWVCRRWRELAIGTPSLWSHVDLELADYEDNPPPPEIERLWLERAGSLPLHVHFNCTNNEFEHYTPRFTAFPQLLRILIPLASQIATLGFRGLGARQFVEGLTEIRLAQGPINRIVALYLAGAAGTGFAPPGRIDPLPLAWPPSLFRGISELIIDDLPEAQCPSLYQLTTILSNCPQIYSLRLHQMTIREDPGAGSFPTVHLPHLRFLSLHDVSERSQRKILSFLRPGSAELHLEINVVEDNPPAFNAATTFITNFCVTSLCLWPPLFWDEDDTQISPYLPFAQSVHTLFLPLDIRSTSAIATLLSPMGNRTWSPRLPNLKCLCLMHGRFWPGDSELLKRLIAAHSLQKLILVSCKPRVSEYEATGVEERNKAKYQEMIEWVSQKVPELIIHNYTTNSIYPHWYMFLRRLLSIYD